MVAFICIYRLYIYTCLHMYRYINGYIYIYTHIYIYTPVIPIYIHAFVFLIVCGARRPQSPELRLPPLIRRHGPPPAARLARLPPGSRGEQQPKLLIVKVTTVS